MSEICLRKCGERQIWEVDTAKKRNIEILKTLCYFEPMGMVRKRNKLFEGHSETIMGTS